MERSLGTFAKACYDAVRSLIGRVSNGIFVKIHYVMGNALFTDEERVEWEVLFDYLHYSGLSPDQIYQAVANHKFQYQRLERTTNPEPIQLGLFENVAH